MEIYSIRDKKADFYHPPFYCQDDVQAKRLMLDIARNNDNMIAKYPDDYSLHNIGTFNESTAIIVPCIPPVLVAELREFAVIANA